MATHSSIIAWKIPWTARLSSWGHKSCSQMSVHVCVCVCVCACVNAYTHTRLSYPCPNKES